MQDFDKKKISFKPADQSIQMINSELAEHQKGNRLLSSFVKGKMQASSH
jgi:hypothetical protein